ncbi:hypothetical protein RsoM2USA_166 [Ralstonia phage RsoM2USA]|nr:hypothetical protein RsoM2USA_166 [Ralstonia phage RsoM2USA]
MDPTFLTSIILINGDHNHDCTCSIAYCHRMRHFMIEFIDPTNLYFHRFPINMENISFCWKNDRHNKRHRIKFIWI